MNILKVDKYLLLIIILSFISGFLYYYFLRSPIVGILCLGIEQTTTLNFHSSNYFLWFPTFIHPFIFSLLSWWAMGYRYLKSSIFFWLTINLIAEIGQGVEQSFFDNFPIILKKYFQYGTFDWYDILSIVFGAVFAYVFILKIKKG